MDGNEVQVCDCCTDVTKESIDNQKHEVLSSLERNKKEREMESDYLEYG